MEGGPNRDRGGGAPALGRRSSSAGGDPGNEASDGGARPWSIPLRSAGARPRRLRPRAAVRARPGAPRALRRPLHRRAPRERGKCRNGRRVPDGPRDAQGSKAGTPKGGVGAPPADELALHDPSSVCSSSRARTARTRTARSRLAQEKGLRAFSTSSSRRSSRAGTVWRAPRGQLPGANSRGDVPGRPARRAAGAGPAARAAPSCTASARRPPCAASRWRRSGRCWAPARARPRLRARLRVGRGGAARRGPRRGGRRAVLTASCPRTGTKRAPQRADGAASARSSSPSTPRRARCASARAVQAPPTVVPSDRAGEAAVPGEAAARGARLGSGRGSSAGGSSDGPRVLAARLDALVGLDASGGSR